MHLKAFKFCSSFIVADVSEEVWLIPSISHKIETLLMSTTNAHTLKMHNLESDFIMKCLILAVLANLPNTKIKHIEPLKHWLTQRQNQHAREHENNRNSQKLKRKYLCILEAT